jgi:hypothetical protein
MPPDDPYGIKNAYSGKISDADRAFLNLFETEDGGDAEQALRLGLLQQNVSKAAYGGLGDILSSGGMTPQQRAMLSATMSRSLGAQAQQAGLGLGRRAAAQGIGGTGLANAGLGQIQSGLLSAQQQGEEGINQQSLDLYRSALQSALGIAESDKDRKAREEQQKAGRTGFGGLLGGVAGSFLGPLGGAFGKYLGDELFD